MNISHTSWLRHGLAALGSAIAIAAAAEPSTPAATDAAAKPGGQAAASAAKAEPIFAHVGDQDITLREYSAALADAMRKKFYHGKPPEEEVVALRREVGQSLIDDRLIFKEAQRRKIEPDEMQVKGTIASYEERYAGSPQWQQNRERLLPGLTRLLERQSVVARMRSQVIGSVSEPAEYEVKSYYEQYPQKFTEPAQVHLLSILLKVDPSSGKAEWDKAMEEGRDIVKRLAGGADFAELAKVQSADASAAKGGDMGWLHLGVLPPKVQKVVDALKVGQTSKPFLVLEGVAVVRLVERKPAQLMAFDDVRRRATLLRWQEQRDDAWRSFVGGLREATPVRVDESIYTLKPAEPGTKQATTSAAATPATGSAH